MRFLQILAILATFGLAIPASADFINEVDPEGSRVGVDTPQNPDECEVVNEIFDGDVCAPAHADGGDSGDSGGEGEGDSGDSGGEGEGDGGEGEGEGEGQGPY
jgi:hypothetical protein